VIAPLSWGSGNAITIESSDVVLDFNGYVLSTSLPQPPPMFSGAGVSAIKQASNVTIKNGTIRGFDYGIQAYDWRHSVIEDMHLEENRLAMSVSGAANTVRHNYVLNAGKGQTASSAIGIVVAGTGIRVIDNDVVETDSGLPSLEAIWIASNGPSMPGDGAVVEGNRISAYKASAPGVAGGPSAMKLGIHVDSTNSLIVNNRLEGLDYGIAMNGNPTAKYRDNLTVGVTLPYQGGTNAGNNN
jgi:hypothetical protein